MQRFRTSSISYVQYINDIVDLFANSDVYVKIDTDDIKIYLEIISASGKAVERLIRLCCILSFANFICQVLD